MTLLGFILTAIHGLILIVLLLTAFAYMTYAERRVVARMQWRLGPNRVGPRLKWMLGGLLQPAADGLKLLVKEQLIPREAKKFLFQLAPCISLVVACSGFAVIPLFEKSTLVFGHELAWVADLDVSVLYLLGVSSLGVYGIILGGWSSSNKYALLGAIRSSAQVLSYELALGMALVSPLLMAGTLSFRGVVEYQVSAADGHGLLVLWQPIAFILYWIAAVAEVNRAPFDLPEAEQELGAGYHTEYSGMRFAMFFMAEYINMLTVSAVAATVFWGGPGLFPGSSEFYLSGPIYFALKVAVFMFIFIWLRATFPRFRYDQLMRIGWQVLLPLGLLNVIVTAVGVALHWPLWGFTLATVGMVLALAGLSAINRKPAAAHAH